MLLGVPKRTLIIAAVLAGVFVVYLVGDGRGGVNGIDVGGVTGSGCRFTVTADALNVRSGPSTGAGVVGELARRQTVTASATVRDGFRKLGDRGWVSAEYLRPVPGSSC